MAKKRKKPKMEFRYYQMPAGSPILALLGQKWVQHYGENIDYLHFHNYLEIGFCYEGQGRMLLGEEEVRFSGREFSVIPPNYPHTTVTSENARQTITSVEMVSHTVETEMLLRRCRKSNSTTRTSLQKSVQTA